MASALIWTIVLVTGLGAFAIQIYGRFAVLLRMRTDDNRDYSPRTWPLRLKNTLVYAFAQKKFFRDDQPAGVMHIIIFWGFVVLLFQVLTMFARGWSTDVRLPFFGMDYLGGPYGLMKDGFEVAVLFGVSIALFRWAIVRPTRLYGFLPAEAKLRTHSHWEAFVILGFIATIMISGLLYDAGRMVFMSYEPDMLLEMKWQPISGWLASLFHGNVELAETVSGVAWWVHNLVVLSFLNLLPRSKHFHIITAIPNVFFGKIEPKGRLGKRDFTVDNPLFGRSQVNLFTWKQTLDMYSCTECGRCSSQCPATATGKTLAPRQFLIDLRNQVYDDQLKLLQIDGTKNRKEGYAGEFPMVVGDDRPIIDDVVWSCVNCRACEEFCPVNIEYIDKIDDIRQHLVQEVARFPEELGRAFKGMENNSNPWGIAAHERDAWAEGMDVPRIADKPDAEYLYYVGCGGSFDTNNKKATQSFVKVMKEAGVSFAIMGKDELCNGETARRLGNEYLYQTMAEGLTNSINAVGVKKIVVNCPHCYNTLKNESPEFGGNFEVTHAAELVGKLVDEGKVKIGKEGAGMAGKNIVYHDSCYYGRFNNVYDEPRNLIEQVPACHLLEMDKCRHAGMCCGAGGGRMWMEEKADQRVNILRTDQALAKNPDVIATSCPFCKIMISSGINEKGLADKVQVMDVMEIVAQNMQTT